MGDRLGIPMNVVFFPLSFFFYQLSLFLSLLVHSLDLHPSSSYSFLIAFFAFKSTCFRPSLCLFPLSLSLLTSACFPRCFCRCLSWGLSAGLSCAVICHTTEGKIHLLLMLPSCRSVFCVSVSQAIWVLPSSQVSSLLLLGTRLFMFLKICLWLFAEEGSVLPPQWRLYDSYHYYYYDDDDGPYQKQDVTSLLLLLFTNRPSAMNTAQLWDEWIWAMLDELLFIITWNSGQ